MHQLIPAVPIPPPPRQPWGICSSWWGIGNFIACLGAGHLRIPARFDPWAFDTRVFKSVLKVCFFQFLSISSLLLSIIFINISDNMNYILSITKQLLT